MAATVTPIVDDQVYKLPLKVLVIKEKKQVLFAEAGKDFVDILFSFLTFPLGTLSKLMAVESNLQEPVRLGSISSLDESVTHLEEEHFRTQNCKEMLLNPRNSLASYCQKMKLNIDDATEPIKYFICENWECSRKVSGSLLSINFRNERCTCGKLLNREIFRENVTLEDGFVKETARFIICDDLHITPNVFGASVQVFQKLGITDMQDIEERTMHISKKEVVNLLKFSLISETPMTDFIFKKEQPLDKFSPQLQFDIAQVPSDEGKQMLVKIQIRKSNGKIVFAEAEEDFADFIFSFLTFPLGGVLHMLKGFSSLSCIDKLYKSISDLNAERYLRSQEVKDKLANPRCAFHFNVSNQMLPIEADCLPVYYCYSVRNYVKDRWVYSGTLVTSPKAITRGSEMDAPLNIVDPRSPTGESSSTEGFAKGPSIYMVTDDLVVTPMSTVFAISYLNRLGVPLFDVEERVITIGLKECLGILKASLTSASALTNGLKHLMKSIKREN
ncbi:hypothetical protein RJT34_17578 [Clitoria ternatea]|uniref:DUF674 family protein n=1 Tax=Clitoria ternatea TaxID=43366 RepID=A0AAN9J978_CLITE